MDHPDLETLAAHAEDRLDEAAAARVRAHLVGCRRCADLFADTTRFLVASAAVEPSRSVRRSRRFVARAGLAMAAVLVLAVGLGRVALDGGAVDPLGPELRARLDRARIAASDQALVLDGSLADVRSPRYRDAEPAGPLHPIVDALREAHAASPRDPGLASEFATVLLLDGNAEAARLVTDRALEHVPGDRRLLMTRAVVAFRQSELDTAAGILERLVASGDEVASLNLAMVDVERGEVERARERLRALADHADRTDVRARASRELEAVAD